LTLEQAMRDELVALIDARFIQLIELHDSIVLSGAMPTRDEFIASIIGLPKPEPLTSNAQSLVITNVQSVEEIARQLQVDQPASAVTTVERPAASPKIYAPWDANTVDALNAFQYRENFHPFTCPHTHLDGNGIVRGGEVKLHAYSTGWKCSDIKCDYTQSWAHEFMIDHAGIVYHSKDV